MRLAFIALVGAFTMPLVLACSSDDGGGSSGGAGGSTAGTGGSTAGTGGSTAGTGGSTAGTGGSGNASGAAGVAGSGGTGGQSGASCADYPPGTDCVGLMSEPGTEGEKQCRVYMCTACDIAKESGYIDAICALSEAECQACRDNYTACVFGMDCSGDAASVSDQFEGECKDGVKSNCNVDL